MRPISKEDIEKMNHIREMMNHPDEQITNDFQKKLAGFRMRQMMQTEEERVSPDTYSCDCVFIVCFITDTMEDDFPLIAKDFLQHEMTHLKEYATPPYADISPNASWPKRSYELQILNLIVSAFRKGNAYARGLLQNLYKTYYRKDYQQLKRFQQLSAEEVMSLSDDGSGPSPSATAIILTAASFYGIQIGEDCAFYYLYMDDYYQHLQEDVERLYDYPVWSKEEVNSAKETINELFTDDDAIWKAFDGKGRLVSNILQYLCYPEDYLELCDREMYEPRRDYEIALNLLRRTWPKQTFNKEEVADAAMLLHAIRALTSICDEMEEENSCTLGTDDGDFYDHFPPLFDPAKTTGVQKGFSRNDADLSNNGAKASSVPAGREEGRRSSGFGITRGSIGSSESGKHRDVRELSGDQQYTQEALQKEVDRLREEKHSLEADNQYLRSRNKELAHAHAEDSRIFEEYENDRRELAALREHVYQFTEVDITPDQKSFAEMKATIGTRKIVIIGGHSNWVNKLRNMYPEWNFVSPNVSGAVDPRIVEHADHVYFFTDTIGHSTYYRYVQILRENKIPFGYIHGVNIEANTAQIYRDMTAGSTGTEQG